ncbi:MAG: DUF1428 domain-containing protein [Pseudomonadota bacterium]
MFHDIFVAAVKESRRAEYLEHAGTVAAVFRAHGALSYIENWGVDLMQGERTSFPKAVELEAGEAVVVGWAVWPDQAARDGAMPGIMPDPAMQAGMKALPIDGTRMIFGGFETVLER